MSWQGSRECLGTMGPRWKLNYSFFVRTRWSHLGKTRSVITHLDSWDKVHHCRWVPQTWGALRLREDVFLVWFRMENIFFYRCHNLRLLQGGELTPWSQRHISPQNTCIINVHSPTKFVFCILFGFVKFDFNHYAVVLERLLCSLRKCFTLCFSLMSVVTAALFC